MSAPAPGSFDPPSTALVSLSKIKESREGRPPLPVVKRLCGRVVNVAIWEEPHWSILTKSGTRAGRFVRLRNVHEGFFDDVGLNCKWSGVLCLLMLAISAVLLNPD